MTSSPTANVILIILGLIGFSGIVSGLTVKLIGKKLDKSEAKREEREQARIDRQILVEEQLVAVGYVAKETAEAHLAKCGPSEKITTALETMAECRKRSENQLRKSAAKYELSAERMAQ